MTDNRINSVLLLDDQGLVRAGMAALITISEPYAHIDEASSHEEALHKLSEKAFDVAFLDIDLKSTKSGLDVLKFIRKSEFDTRVIMLSANSERETVLECLNEGASGYILKDLENDGIFKKALNTIFQGSIFLPPNVMGRGGFIPQSLNSTSKASLLGLTERSLEVLFYLCQGLPNKGIARKMNIEEGTIRKDYVPKLFKTFNVTRRTELMIEVARRNLIIPKPLHH